ncbi:MAG: efflux RND transporter periplasmic adaptor subunit [Planctomycetota bacterium]
MQRRSTAMLAWTLVTILTVMTAVLGYREFERSGGDGTAGAAAATSAESDGTTTSAEGAKTAGTSAAPVADSGKIALESKGYLIPAHQILVSPKVSGMVTKLFVEEGMRVEKGQVLGELEKIDYEADLRRSRATLMLAMARRDLMRAGSREEEREQAHAELAEAERQVLQLKQEYTRNLALRSKDKSLVSDSLFQEQESQYEAMIQKAKRLGFRRDQVVNGNRKEEIQATEAEVEQAHAEVVKAEWRLSNCTIRAPISGTVLKKNAEEGNIVNPVAFNGSFSLCDLADLSDLEVDLSIQERDVSKVYPRQICQIRSEAYPDRVYEGYVDRLMPIADRAKGAVPVRVKVKVAKSEEGVYLKPDMSAVVTFLNTRVNEPSPNAVKSATNSESP